MMNYYKTMPIITINSKHKKLDDQSVPADPKSVQEFDVYTPLNSLYTGYFGMKC